jgi:hypothetical protein
MQDSPRELQRQLGVELYADDLLASLIRIARRELDNGQS